MWYFTWMLGIGFAVLLAILNVLWMENEDGRQNSLRARREGDDA
ncbi:cytochrome bd-I oxidase subunit CydX [Zoogloeaceae bacteirum Par-f-2]|nr:cytochrome bd-I oxidase subunit CydX [Zoogloeaceae bacteirum Par-f-2]